ncbi:MAG TPA: hypothetical protein VHJ18_17240 [Streptosporangiaceae bacterium]|jgi:hypothetical protein|nr:hypothetical protein [Streptosporangiaceae bacterium]
MDQFVHKDRRQASVSVPGDEVDLRKVRLEPLPAGVGAGPGVAPRCTDTKSSANSYVNATVSAER